jgi:hypothetical protein
VQSKKILFINSPNKETGGLVMKKNIIIWFLTGIMLTFLSVEYTVSQEYDDLYYNPKKKDNEEIKAVAEDDFEKSDYEKYIETLEKEAEANNKSQSFVKSQTDTAEYDKDIDYVEPDYLDSQEQAKKNSDQEYYDDYYSDYESRFDRFNSNCSNCGYYDVVYATPQPRWSFGFYGGYPYSGWSVSYGYPSYYYGYYDPFYYPYYSYYP